MLHPDRRLVRRRALALLGDPGFRGVLWQGAAVAIVVGIIAYFASNASDNLARQHISSGFAFLWREAGFGISESLIAYSPADAYGRAILVGLLNTLQVAVTVSVASTLLGLVLGIARLSDNPLLARLAAGYVETVRNVPLIIQLFFWYAIVRQLPGPRQALSPVGGVFISNRGILMPTIEARPGAGLVASVLLGGIAAAWALRRAAYRRQMEHGQASLTWPFCLVLVVGLPALILCFAPNAFTVSAPILQGFNFKGGTAFSPEFAALFIGMTIYATAFTAEIVRAGIQAVPRGQWETALSLGLGPLRTLRLVVLPQSLRTAIPPMTSQYVNNTKNSSLAVAIGYPDLVSVSGTTMNQTGQALEAILLFMLVYLGLSLATSLAMNAYNRRMELRER